MRVKCVICDNIETIDDQTSLAKRLRNRPIHTFMCDSCADRIGQKTKAHWGSGDFTLYHHHTEKDEW